MAQSNYRERVERIIVGDEPAASAIQFLQTLRPGVAPTWETLKPEWDANLHPSTLKARKLKHDNPEREVPIIGLSDQQRYVRRAIDLMFSKSVTREWQTSNESGEEDPLKADIAKTIESVLSQNAYDALNRERFTSYFGACQMATIWESYQKTKRDGAIITQKYGGKESDYKIACKTYSPMAGDKIHPVYDDRGDLVLLGISTACIAYGQKEEFFIIMSSEGVQTYRKNGADWEAETEGLQATAIGKIPGIFIERNAPIWGNTSPITYERESKIIDNSMVIEYNSVPDRVVKLEGDTAEEDLETLQIQLGIKKKNAAGEVVEVPPEQRHKKANFSRNWMGKGLSLDIQEWSGATDALTYHMGLLKELQDDDIGLPDLTPNAIANISTDTLQLILEVSALRVISESGKIEEFMRREISVIKELVKPMFRESEHSEIDDLEFKVQIHPFQISNEAQRIQNQLLKNGNKPLDSWENSVKTEVGAEKFEEIWEQLQAENVADAEGEQGSLL